IIKFMLFCVRLNGVANEHINYNKINSNLITVGNKIKNLILQFATSLRQNQWYFEISGITARYINKVLCFAKFIIEKIIKNG
ncbi:MAG: hypothetical protein ACI4TX_04755, partial [Christensenellales bacterium]